MRVILAILILLLTATTNAPAVETDHLQGLRNTDYVPVNSTIVGRPFHVFIMLPDSYGDSPGLAYPTIYVLDGGALFPLLSTYYRYLNFGEEIPDAIIVGISYGSETFEGGNFRSTDFTAESAEREYWGGADKFQGFLSDELIPLIESRYRSRSEQRIIFGQSLGGQFVLYTALTQPDLFWGHIASNPALHRNLPFFLRRHAESATGKPDSRLFFASGTNDDPVFREPAVSWMEHWSNQDDLPWQLEVVSLEGHSHMSAPPASFRRGMRWLFADGRRSAKSRAE